MQEIGEELEWDHAVGRRDCHTSHWEACVGTLGNADLRIWKAEYPVLTRPLGRGIAETSNSNPARQTTFDGGFDQIGCEKGERDRHVDLADAAFFARGDLLDTVTLPRRFHRASADHGRSMGARGQAAPVGNLVTTPPVVMRLTVGEAFRRCRPR